MEHQRKTVDLSNGEKYAYFDLGDSTKKTLVLIHGNASSSAFFDLLFEGFKNDFRIVAPDLRGYGQSTYNTPINNLEDLADDLKLFVDALGLKSFVLFGWSLGGGVTMIFSAKHPDYVEKLVLHNSMGIKGTQLYKLDASFKFTDERCTTEDDIKSHFIVQAGIKRCADKEIDKMIMALKIGVWNGAKVPSEERLKVYGEEGVLQRNYLDSIFALNLRFNISSENNGIIDGNGLYKNIKCKILAFAGKKDILVPFKVFEETKAAFGDQMELVGYDDAGHSVMEDHTEEVVKGIIEFSK